jgi:hypothetical protein
VKRFGKYRESTSNGEKIGKIWKKGKLNGDKIWTIGRKKR